jgi:hypothetical protein
MAVSRVKTSSVLQGFPKYRSMLAGNTAYVPVAYYLESNNVLYLNSMYVDSNLNTYIAGGFIPSSRIQKIDNTGAVTWTKEQGTSPEGWAWNTFIGMSVDATGKPTTTGFNSVSGVRQGTISNFNSTGTPIWNKTLSTTATIAYYQNVQDSAGNIYVSGYDTPSNNGGLLVKYNSSGTLQWQRQFGIDGTQAGGTYSTQYGSPNLVVDSTNANVYIAMLTDYYSSSRRLMLRKVSSSGTTVWQRLLYGSASAGLAFQSVARDSSDNVYVMTSMLVSGGTYTSLAIAKYDASGAIQWQRKFSQSGQTADWDYGSIACDSNGNVYVVATVTTSTYSSTRTTFILAYNSSGVLQWQRYLKNGSLGTSASAISVNDTTLTIGSNQNVPGWTMRVPSDGSKTGTYSFNGGSWTYGIPTGTTEAAGTFTEAAGAVPSATTTYTDTTFTFTADNSITATNTVTNL